MLFRAGPSVILTSATLSTSNERGFNFFKSRVGLDQAKAIQLGSPFNYREQAELILVEGMPDPSTQRVDFETRLPEVLKRYIGMTDGHAFALFTSMDLLRRTAQRLRPWMEEHGLIIYDQSDGTPRNQLLEAFKRIRAEYFSAPTVFGKESMYQEMPSEM